MKSYLEFVFKGQSLSRADAEQAMDLILEGGAAREQISAFLGALQAKEESVDEILGFLDSIKKNSPQVAIADRQAIDVCGTGGDGSSTFNISTAVALVVAGCGVTIAKHGNRSVSSLCGSADVLEELGFSLDMNLEKTVKCINENKFGFFFAPKYHPVLAKVRDLRKAIGVKTVFNLLGPMTNPARVNRQLLGVYDSSRLKKIADVLRGAGTVEAMVVCSDDGLDEFSLSGPTNVAHLKNGTVREFKLRPADFGIAEAPRDFLKGGDAKENAAIIQKIINGEKGPRRDVVVMNSSAALVIAGKAQDFQDGVLMASDAIDSLKVKALLLKLVSL
jgi:anthranilate phosphoribosyltransferase